MNQDQDNIQGHPRAFIASYAKDLIVAMISAKAVRPQKLIDIIVARFSSKKVKPETLTDMMTEWTYLSDYIYDWVMQDQHKPMSDDQYIYLENLLEQKTNLAPDLLGTIKANVKMYTVAEAGRVIEMLLDPQLPLEYRDNLIKAKDIQKATSDRARREP